MQQVNRNTTNEIKKQPSKKNLQNKDLKSKAKASANEKIPFDFSSGSPQNRRFSLFFTTLPFFVFGITLVTSLLLWRVLANSFRQKAQNTYTAITENISQNIIKRMHDHEQLLLGGVGLFNTKENVTRTDWRHYISSLQLDQNHPGILGVGYSQWISPSEKKNHIQKIRKEGFPEYQIKPDGERPIYTSIIYLVLCNVNCLQS